MEPKNILNSIDQMDIYLIDQILKNRYQIPETILDIGCGTGRNLKWFYLQGFHINAIDQDEKNIKKAKINYPLIKDNILLNSVQDLREHSIQYDHLICNAVLHFAKSELDFFDMMDGIFKVLKIGGSLFIRLASNIGIEAQVVPIQNGIYELPDGTKRFLLTRTILNKIEQQYDFDWLEPFRTVNVNDKRCMSTLVLKKN